MGWRRRSFRAFSSTQPRGPLGSVRPDPWSQRPCVPPHAQLPSPWFWKPCNRSRYVTSMLGRGWIASGPAHYQLWDARVLGLSKQAVPPCSLRGRSNACNPHHAHALAGAARGSGLLRSSHPLRCARWPFRGVGTRGVLVLFSRHRRAEQGAADFWLHHGCTTKPKSVDKPRVSPSRSRIGEQSALAVTRSAIVRHKRMRVPVNKFDRCPHGVPAAPWELTCGHHCTINGCIY